MRYITILFLLASISGDAQCVNNVNGVNIPCDSAQLAWYNQQQIQGHTDSVNYAIAAAQKATNVAALRSLAYAALQGSGSTTTFTAAQIQDILKSLLWNAGAVNPQTGKVDSTQNYIHP